MKDLTIKTLHKAVDWIANKSNEDICAICAYNNPNAQETPDNVYCFYWVTNGNTACRNGIIEHFQAEV